MNDYPGSVAFLGGCGRFQLVIFFVLCASIMPNGFGSFTLVFLTDVTSYQCLVPDVNLTEDWRKSIIPVKVVNGEPELSRCSRYRLDVVTNLSAQGLVPGRDVNLTDLEQEGCMDGWSYSKDIYQSTLVSEYDLVCSDEWKRPFTSTVFFLGVIVGSFFSGQLSDRFGRKPVLFATMAVQTVFTFIQVFSTSWTMFTVLVFINGLGQMSNFVAALVLGAEILTGEMRVLYSSLGSCLGFAIGYMMLPLFAYFFRDWKSLLLALALPSLAYIPLWWLIPESPLWLLSQGRVEEAEAIVRKAARWNKVQAPRVLFQDYHIMVAEIDPTRPTFPAETKGLWGRIKYRHFNISITFFRRMQQHATVNQKRTDCKESHNVLDLLRISSIRITTLILCLVMFTVTLGYFGLSFNTSHLHADPFLSCFISAAVEVPAYVSSWLALRYLPRRLSVISTMLLEAVSLYLILLVPKSLTDLSLALEMLGKYGITTVFALMFTYIAELYPTMLRNTATGVCTTFGRVGNCIAPFLLTLSAYQLYLPHIIMGTLAVVSSVAAFFLPESFGQPLPETMQQMLKRERRKCPCITGKANPNTRGTPGRSTMII